jgi:radical SAM protein with 4Fe4S-binding SPASM domain
MGGEPLLVPHWQDILSCLSSLDIETDVVTNGEKMTRDTAYIMRDADAYGISFSLDGPAPVHDVLRAKAGQFDTVARAVEWVQGAGLRVGIITHINRVNFGQLDVLYDILCDWCVNAWQLQLTAPMGNAPEDICIDPVQLKRLHDFAVEKQAEGLVHLYLADNIGYFHPKDPELRSGRTRLRCWMGCQAGLTTLGISSDGHVRGCMSLPDAFDEGSIRERALVDIWRDPELFSYNRKEANLSGPCAACELGKVCRGGCASFSYAASGNIGAMPLCRHFHRAH